MRQFFFFDGKKIPPKSLRYKKKDVQIEVMRDWFYDNYEDPANSCPYESREGGYQFIYGGPYDANEELQTMFGGLVKYDYIQELADDLQNECFDWSGRSDNADWYDDDLFEAVISSENPFNKFLENIQKIKDLASVEHPNKPKEHLLGILFTNVITALETLSVEMFIKSLENDDSYIANCIEKGNTDFKVSKDITALHFKGAGLNLIKEELVKSIKEHLVMASWHNTDKVVKRYKATFGIKVNKDWPIDEIEKATLTRNDLVHRGGKDKSNNVVVVTEENLDRLIETAMLFARNLNESLKAALRSKVLGDEAEF